MESEWSSEGIHTTITKISDNIKTKSNSLDQELQAPSGVQERLSICAEFPFM